MRIGLFKKTLSLTLGIGCQILINEKYSRNMIPKPIIFTTFVQTLNPNAMLVNFTFQNFRSFRDEKRSVWKPVQSRN